MPNTVLIAYATKYGSTAEVAAAIAKTLEQEGVSTELLDVRSVRDLRDYRAVVFGAPLYNARMLRAERRFLSRHRGALTEMPVAVFALGPLGYGEKNVKTPEKQFDRAIGRHAGIRPLSTALFGGVIDQSKLRFPDKYSPPLKRFFPITDVRDWQAVEAWAIGLLDQLKPKL
ncbi:MAG: flavodoxin domain-containing protein [Gaiellaceae bacterium]|jgi:menaquinone-dependent protoporphyrinogen oxidase